MKHTEIVIAAINALNKNKNTNIEYDIPTDNDEDGVDIMIKYPNASRQHYGFVAKWFKAEHINFEDCNWMEGFEVPERLRITNPEAVMILRIAWYFYKTGRDDHLF